MNVLWQPDKYAPLTEQELAAAGSQAAPDNDDSECIMPVADNALPMPEAHFSFGKASMRWPYRNASGGLLFEGWRFETEHGKEIRPLSLWRARNGRVEWRWKGFPEPRPLYGLDRLATNPDAPVVVCEGEKSADAAAKVFPNSVCITSPGGSQSARKADWTPIKNRKVLIWPDADKSGLDYARAVASILHGQSCEVSIIDAVALACLSPDGGQRGPEEGWDAANAIAEWQHLEALRRTAIGHAKRYEPGPQFISWGDFKMTPSGLNLEKKPKGEGAELETVWIAAPFEILGACRDPHGSCWGKWLRWHDADRRPHTKHISDASLQGDPGALCAALADEGLKINRAQQRSLLNYLGGCNVKGRVTLVHRTGWHEIGGNRVFVLPNETIWPRGSEPVILDASATGPYEAKGSLKDWQGGVGKLASGHALPVLTISAALAGPLLHLAGQEGGGLHFPGASSRGKTTLLQIGASIWGRGATPGYVRAWRATANGLEGAAASAADTVLVLDELGVIDARDAQAAIYGLANGAGKARASRDGSLREPKSWRVLILSSGELPVEAKLSEDRGKRARAGQLVRMLDIPADKGNGFGVFDHAGPESDAGKLAQEFKLAAISAYGTAGPEFVRRIIAENIDGETVRDAIRAFTKTAVPPGADGQIDRAAQRLGLIAAAGELATALGVAPWQQGEARAAAAWALNQWIEHRGGTEPAEIRQAIEQVRLMIELHGGSRFEPLDDVDVKPVPNRLGWRKGSGPVREWMIPPQVWKSEICNGFDPTMVARVLAERKMLRRQGGDTFQCGVKIGGKSTRAYVLTAAIIDGGEDAP